MQANEGIREVRARLHVSGPELERAVVACDRLVDLAERTIGVAQIAVNFRHIGTQGTRLEVQLQRLAGAMQGMQRIAAVDIRLGQTRPQPQRTAVVLDCLVVLVQRLQTVPNVVKRVYALWPDTQSDLVLCDGLGMPLLPLLPLQLVAPHAGQ
ncbi:MAG TPA: hypothetical protein VFS62_16320 [Chloroflexota bacterium]|nr:hypothetical protein [Chloroflexota bacterium]